MISSNQLIDGYFEAWKTIDNSRRHELVQKIFSPDVVQYVVPGNIKAVGLDAVEQNIRNANIQNIQKSGLIFSEGESVLNQGAIQINWDVLTPGGDVVGSGRDFVLTDEEGRITSLYMFMSR